MFFAVLDSVETWCEVCWEVTQAKLYNVPKLVAELSIPNDSLNIKVD
jgi:hypothetical protein